MLSSSSSNTFLCSNVISWDLFKSLKPNPFPSCRLPPLLLSVQHTSTTFKVFIWGSTNSTGVDNSVERLLCPFPPFCKFQVDLGSPGLCDTCPCRLGPSGFIFAVPSFPSLHAGSMRIGTFAMFISGCCGSSHQRIGHVDNLRKYYEMSACVKEGLMASRVCPGCSCFKVPEAEVIGTSFRKTNQRTLALPSSLCI